MKKPTILLAFLLLTLVGFATPIKAIVTNGTWKSASTWDLNRIPVTSDTIIVPANKTLIVDNQQTLGNVFVQVQGILLFKSGKLTLGSGTEIVVFPGGVIAGASASEKIRIGNTEVFSGAELPVTGPAIANSTTGSFTDFALPVKFLSFTVTASANASLLQWATASEAGADRYEIERSTDGNNWLRIGVVAAAGNTNVTSNYAYSDRNAPAVAALYYRIRQVDNDGRFEYTAVKRINQDVAAAAVKISSARGAVVLHFPKKLEGSLVVSYISMGGVKIGEQRLNDAFGQVVLHPGSAKGAFIVSITNASDLKIAGQVIL